MDENIKRGQKCKKSDKNVKYIQNWTKNEIIIIEPRAVTCSAQKLKSKNCPFSPFLKFLPMMTSGSIFPIFAKINPKSARSESILSTLALVALLACKTLEKSKGQTSSEGRVKAQKCS